MTQMKRKPLIPGCAVFPTAVSFLCNLLVYYATKPFTTAGSFHSLATKLDEAIPLCPAFVSVYFLAFVQWGLGYVMAARESRETCCRMAAGDIAAKLLCGVCFFLYPTTMLQPEVTGSGLWAVLLRMTYAVDNPTNIFPSIHCLESWVCCRTALRMKTASPAYKIGMTIFSLLVFASTVLVKQHVLLDIPAGIAAAELGFLVSDTLKMDKALSRWEDRLLARTSRRR